MLDIEPDFPIGRYNLGLALLQLGQLPEAIECFERAVQLRPNYASAHNSLGIALFRSGQNSQAIEHFRIAVQRQRSRSKCPKQSPARFFTSRPVERSDPALGKSRAISPRNNRCTKTGACRRLPQDGPNRRCDPTFPGDPSPKIRLPAGILQFGSSAGKPPGSAIVQATAKKGIEIVQYLTGQLSAAVQMESWLEQYRLELGRIDGAAAPVTARSGVK